MLMPGIYRHYKGALYRVHAVARSTDNPSTKLVTYQALYDSEEFGHMAWWSRPEEEFKSQVLLEDGSRVDRFEFVSAEETGQTQEGKDLEEYNQFVKSEVVDTLIFIKTFCACQLEAFGRCKSDVAAVFNQVFLFGECMFANGIKLQRYQEQNKHFKHYDDVVKSRNVDSLLSATLMAIRNAFDNNINEQSLHRIINICSLGYDLHDNQKYAASKKALLSQYPMSGDTLF